MLIKDPLIVYEYVTPPNVVVVPAVAVPAGPLIIMLVVPAISGGWLD